jgi:hypothetical protein
LKGTIDLQTAFTKVDKIDKQITETMLRAEKEKCSKKDQALWTPSIQQSNYRIQYWNIKLKATRQHICCTKRLNYIKGKFNYESYTIIEKIEKSNASLSTALRKEIKEHNKLCMENVEDRRAYLQQKMDDLNKQDQYKTTIKELMRREQSRNDFAIIK